jgi:hypothetical protein
MRAGLRSRYLASKFTVMRALSFDGLTGLQVWAWLLLHRFPAADDRIEDAEHTEVLMFPSPCGSTPPTLSETRQCKDG